MIAELAAFNAAFGVVKAAIGNGRDIMSCAKQIGDMIGAPLMAAVIATGFIKPV